MKNIVLIGMPGCGKTTLGKYLADKLNRPFIDMDEFLEKENGMSIAKMCEEHGKEYFRDKESEIALKMSEFSGYIISTGGGVILRNENVKALEKNGIIIFIDRTPEDIVGKGVEIEHRPFLENEKAIFDLYNERIEIYRRSAMYTVKNIDKAKAENELLSLVKNIYEKSTYAVIGYPLEHTLSPAIHTPVLDFLCDDAEYIKESVEPKNLSNWIERVKNENIKGFNVTMPHKNTIMPMLDFLHESATYYGSVNTVVNKDGVLTGYNTDANGFYLALKDDGFIVNEKIIIFLGAGGAARALIKGAVEKSAKKIIILARNVEKAKEITPKTSNASIICDKLENVNLYCKDADLLVNCTPLGMTGISEDFTNLSFIDLLPERARVSDLIYKPAKTKFLQKAENRGLETQNGLSMLIYQALIADKYYTNANFDMREIYNVVSKKLKL